jgi:gluconate 2-dehydrogenase gamma chain
MTSVPKSDAIMRERHGSREDSRWPEGAVRALLNSDLVTPPTREALRRRLERDDTKTPRFLERHDFLTLQAVCARLIPQPERLRPIDIAGQLDARLADGIGDGWRYAVMPPDRVAHVRGLQGLDETAEALFGAPFQVIGDDNQDAVLSTVQAGKAPGATWRELSAPYFFKELLAEVVDIYYAHPLAQEEIGYAGMADAHGWQAIGLNERDPHEPTAGAPAVRGQRSVA